MEVVAETEEDVALRPCVGHRVDGSAQATLMSQQAGPGGHQEQQEFGSLWEVCSDTRKTKF